LKYIIVNDLSHSGIPGMRWGIRRYQNPDGSYTEEGKIRYGRYSDMTRDQKKQADKYSRDRNNTGNAMSNAARSGAEIARTWKNKRVKNSPASKMTDAELRNAINRMSLERQYNQLTGADTRRGAEAAEKILNTTAAVVSIGVGVMTMMDMARKWPGPRVSGYIKG